MKSGIYRINLGNGYYYIGSSVRLQFRKTEHGSALRLNKHYNIRMQRNWNKYGVFEFVVLVTCPQNELLYNEQIWLNAHFTNPKNLNLLPTAGRTTGFRHSALTRKRMSDLAKKRPAMAIATRRKISETLTGIPLSGKNRIRNAAHLKAMNIGRTGTPRSATTRDKISAAHLGKQLSPAHRESLRAARLNSPRVEAANKARRGAKASAETRAKLSAARKGKPLTDAHRKNLSIAHKLRHARLRMVA
jgi:group I intron endonuclease